MKTHLQMFPEWLGSGSEQKGECELSTSIHLPLLPDGGQKVTSLPQTRAPGLPHQEVYPQTVRRKPFLPEVAL